MDDVPFRGIVAGYSQLAHVPCIVTSHTDFTKIHSFAELAGAWANVPSHMSYNIIHATVSKTFANYIGVPVAYTWPPLIWSDKFRNTIDDIQIQAQRNIWKQKFGRDPSAILVYVGRISPEKLIHLLIESLPDAAGLIIIGENNTEYTDRLKNMIVEKKNVIFENRNCSEDELHIIYSSMDMLVSASDFETLGNTLIEAWIHSKPVAVLPEQGHLEFLRDKVNGFAIHYKEPKRAREELTYAIKHKETLQPSLNQQSTYFKSVNFASEFKESLIDPALRLRFSIYDQMISLIICVVLTCLHFIVVNYCSWVNISHGYVYAVK